jgi:cyclic pyranopterin phosphate synthase
MPSEGLKPFGNRGLLSDEEILRIVRISASLGVKKIRMTGGEPLIRKNLSSLIGSVSRIEGVEDISLTTNGQLLKRYAHSLFNEIEQGEHKSRFS